MGYSTLKRSSKGMLRISVILLVCMVVVASLAGSFGARIYAEPSPQLNIVTEPTDHILNVGESASVTLEVVAQDDNDGELSYQWYRSDPDFGNFALQGKTEATLTLPTTSVGTNYYYVVILNKDTLESATSRKAMVQVNALPGAATPDIDSQPEPDTTVNVGDSVVLHVAASLDQGVNGSLSYQWYRNGSNSTSGGVQLGTPTGNSFFNVPTGGAGVNYYYVVVINTDSSAPGEKTASVTSSIAKVTVTAVPDTTAATPSIDKQPKADTEASVGDSVVLQVEASLSGSGSLSYQWYRNDSNSTSGGVQLGTPTGNSFFNVPTGGAGVNYYYVVVTNTDTTLPGNPTASVTSSAAKVTVTAVPNAEAATPGIDSQPAADTVADEGDSVVLHVAASLQSGDSGELSYQWYRSDSNSNSGGVQLGSATGSSFTVPTAGAGVNYYYVVVTNTDTTLPGNPTASVTSSVAKVTVNALTGAAAPIIDTQMSATQTVNEGDLLTLSVGAHSTDGGTLTYAWYRIVNENNTVQVRSATADAAFPAHSAVNPGDAYEVYYYYPVVTNTNNDVPGAKTASATGDVIAVTVNANAVKPVFHTHPQWKTVLEDVSVTLNVEAAIEGTGAFEGTGTLSYQWYQNTTNSTTDGTLIPDAIDAAYTAPTSVVGVTYYYAVATNTDPTALGYKVVSTTSGIARVKVDARTYTIAPIPDQTMSELDQGYAAGTQQTRTIGINNTGNSPLTNLTASLGGEGAGDFVLTQPASTLESGASDSFTIKARNGLAAGTHTATVTIKADRFTDVTFTVTQVVFAYSIAPIPDQTATVLDPGYAPGTQQTRTIEITNTANGRLTNLAVSLGGEGAEDFVLTQPVPTLESGSPAASFTITARDGLAAGTHTATVTIKADRLTDVTFTVTQVVLAYSIAPIPDQTATELVQSYASGMQQTRTVEITNTGNGRLTNLAVSLGGEGAADFVLTQPASTLESGSPATSFTITAKDGLAAGTHTATVTIKADHLTDVTFTVTQVVKAPEIVNSGTGPASTDVQVLVNGKVEYAGAASTSLLNGQTVTTVTLDPAKMAERLATAGTGALVVIPVTLASDRFTVTLDGQTIQSLEQKQDIVEFRTNNAIYSLPVKQMNFDAVAAQFGANIDLRDIKVQIEIATPAADMAKLVENAADRGKFSVVIPPLDFTVKLVYEGKTVEVAKFNSYVERKIAIPEGVDRTKITTGIVVDPDGTIRHVPSKVTTVDGKDYVVINSLTNSTYTVVWNPLQFSDVAGHWAKDNVNDMGSRMVIGGTGDGLFSPDRDITRAEFVAIIIRGLGLKQEDGTTPFSDAGTSSAYSSAISTAYAYHLISGFEDGTFRPNAKITREQAMTIIAKAMKVTGLSGNLNTAADALLPFTDASAVAAWAIGSVADNVQAGLIKGRTITRLDPKAYITRAEVAAIVQRLLQKSDLI
ncbi:S-layer homology domain-containing protein [Cohnella sp. 56]|uniref:S-layer homology domain-containing protein n=1 Tax=Cohnella sp. 56 TaxID=3113722 RepID=UPI0030E93079